MRHALHLAPFDALADPAALRDIAVAAEATGWDGLFLWDHVYRPEDVTTAIADVWIALTVVATATNRLRLGPMVTPITRRRIATLARQTVTLDHVSAGRLVVGLGLGVDSGRELTAFGEIVDPKVRAARLDEGAGLLAELWSGERVHHDGPQYVADDVRMRPVPIQQPRIPLWFAARGSALAPVCRAARYDGLFPIEMDLATFQRAVDTVRAERGHLDGFEIAVRVEADIDVPAFVAAGATWAIHPLPPTTTVKTAMALAGQPPQLD